MNIKTKNFDSIEDYLNCYMWLTTTPANNIKRENGQYFSGYCNVICAVEYWKPHKPLTEISDGYWENYTWVWRTYVTENGIYFRNPQEYHHIKMIEDKEIEYPPIPQFLFDFYDKYK